MKKFISLLLVCTMLFLVGCDQVKDIIDSFVSESEIESEIEAGESSTDAASSEASIPNGETSADATSSEAPDADSSELPQKSGIKKLRASGEYYNPELQYFEFRLTFEDENGKSVNPEGDITVEYYSENGTMDDSENVQIKDIFFNKAFGEYTFFYYVSGRIAEKWNDGHVRFVAHIGLESFEAKAVFPFVAENEGWGEIENDGSEKSTLAFESSYDVKCCEDAAQIIKVNVLNSELRMSSRDCYFATDIGISNLTAVGTKHRLYYIVFDSSDYIVCDGFVSFELESRETTTERIELSPVNYFGESYRISFYQCD